MPLQGTEKPAVPLHLQVSSVSPQALRAVQAAGGSVERVYYTRLGLKALLKVRQGAAAGEARGSSHCQGTAEHPTVNQTVFE